MRMTRIIGVAATAAIVFARLCSGQDDSAFSLKPNGHASMEAGQIVKGYNKNFGTDPMTNVWSEKIITGFGLDAHFGHNTDFSGGLDVKTFNEFPRFLNPGSTRRFYYYLYLTQAELTHTVQVSPELNLKLGGGYFPYKYNDDVRNLGEYLFRSTAYPQTLSTEFDFPFARLAGAYAKSEFVSGINKIDIDLILNFNTEWVAISDLNLSLVARYNLARVLEIGAGVEFSSLLSADESFTTPHDQATLYQVDGTDSSFYTFRGTKLMARASLDAKQLFKSTIFGDQDLKLYSEAALLGVKNYPAALNSPIWYNSILERIPVMVGFNLPAFRILDVLSLEAEWWGNRYPNSMEGIVYDGLPIPFQRGVSTIDSTRYKNDDVKWSVYLSRSFSKHYCITFQVANDHMKSFAWDWDRQDWEECLRGPDNWYYVLKFGVMF
jgi:hypothetical protein